MDRRQQKTRAAIFSAFTELLQNKSYAKITVQDIIDTANIGRSTFYSHFETKDELLRAMCTEIFEHVFSESLNPENTHDFSLSHRDASATATHILYHLRDSGKRIIGILNSESSELFLKYFKEYLDKSIAAHMLCEYSFLALSAPSDFLINHISGSFINAVQWWIKNGMAHTPEEISEYFITVTVPDIINTDQKQPDKR